METKQIFADRLKNLRAKSGLTLKELSDKVGVSTATLVSYEKAEKTANIDVLRKIAKFFNVSADYLIGLTDAQTTDTNLKAVCEYTGLSEKAVGQIIHYLKPIEAKYFPEVPFGPYGIFKDINNGKFFDGVETVVNAVFSSDYFWSMITELTAIKFIEEPQTSGDEEDHNVLAEIDMLRYRVERDVNRISDYFDFRENPTSKAGEDNGKHNPPEE